VSDIVEQTVQDEVQRKLEAALKDAEMFKDQLRRKAAEFENYKRRNENEMRSLVENATERLILDLLPVIDDFDRFLRSSRDQKDYDALFKGIDLINNKLNRILSARGLAPFESTGKPFDVGYHDALLQIPRGDVPPNTVIEEVNRGFMLNDKVLRHAKVVVSAPADSRDEPTATTDTGDIKETKV
jgi:molecular chaperone GrpE